jgi:hypothetical protein
MHSYSSQTNMKIELDENEISDIKRSLIIAMQQLDSIGNGLDLLLSNRLEVIQDKLSQI